MKNNNKAYTNLDKIDLLLSAFIYVAYMAVTLMFGMLLFEVFNGFKNSL